MMQWPKQSECNIFYGNPRGRNGAASAAWEGVNLTRIKPPFQMYFGDAKVSSIRVHIKCAAAFMAVFNALWVASGRNQRVIDEWGVSKYAGAYNFRLMRGGNSLSMHSWGCAIDLDPANNGMGDATPRFAQYPQVIKAFKDQGAIWGGDWGSKDGMHFQFSRVD